MVETTSIKLEDAVKEALDKLKIHPRQSYSEIIKQLLNNQLKGGAK